MKAFGIYLTVPQTARRWGVTESWVRRLCREGRIQGAFRAGRDWAIPVSATLPDPKPRETPTRQDA